MNQRFGENARVVVASLIRHKLTFQILHLNAVAPAVNFRASMAWVYCCYGQGNHKYLLPVKCLHGLQNGYANALKTKKRKILYDNTVRLFGTP